MPKFHVTGTVTGSKYLGVFEAATPAEAVEKALNEGDCYANLCHQCSSECEDGTVESAEAWPAEETP